ncbi:RDD family protein [Nitrosophilus kaiyonis]|uniref:RDD family protein n=1 Tax=Nitrosophilus kaiyonis TaxID=2930200 RepID=UPI0024926AC5|nr:RDD family protein [Nitrosophilus kaiyonis]
MENRSLASLNKRAIAFLIDDILVSLIYLIIIWEYIPKSGSFVELSIVINQFMLLLVMIKIFYHTYFVYKFRATLGKMALKIEVLSLDYENVNFLQAFNRAIFRVISEIIFYFGFLLAFFDKKRQTLHDKTAKTLVVNV